MSYVLHFPLFVILFVFFNSGVIQASDNSSTFYIAPEGSDTNDGTKQKPFKTLMKARDAARISTADSPKKLILRGGSYYETELVLEPEDSGLTIEAYPGEKPVLYGGRPVKNWKREGEFYTAKIEGVRDRTWDFRLLVVNNKSRSRARLPKTGGFEHLSKTFRVRWLSTSGGGWEIQPSEKQLTTMKYNRKDIGPWLDLRNAELTTYGGWSASLVGLKSMDEETQTLTFSTPAAYPPGSFTHHKMVDGSTCYWKKGQTYIIWNVREGMHEPGQWYLDRTEEKLVYWPMPGEDISKIEAVVPTSITVITIDKGTSGITLDGLVISCATTALGNQWSASSIIAGGGVNDCTFTNLTIENTGGSGISVSGHNNLIEKCVIRHMGKSGISLGGQNNTVTCNHIHDIGKIHYTFCSGISTSGKENIISHNEVHDTAYTAVICMGEKCILEKNRIYSVMKELNDGGCFYIGGTGNIIRRNFCHEGPEDAEKWAGYFERGEKRFNWAYYMDENAVDCVFEENLALNTVRPTHMHMTKNCTFRNNVFIDREIQILSFPRSSGLIFEKNILIADEIVFSNPYDAFKATPNNIFYSRLGVITHEKVMIYTPVDYLPLKPRDGTVFADPLFVDVDNGDYNFKQDSPSHKLGIKPIDVSTAGIPK